MQRVPFNDDWQFHLGLIPSGHKFNDQPWRNLDLPHDWSIELPRQASNPSGANGGFFTTGSAWYRKLFDTPADWRSKKVGIEFEGVYMNAETWLNGHYLGRHPYGYTNFYVDLSPYLAIGEKNELRVKVDNACQKNSRWYSGSGIYRPVWLWLGGPVHIAHQGFYITTPQVSASYASVMARTRVQNDSSEDQDVTLRSYLVSPDGVTMATSTSSAALGPGTEHEFSQKTHLPAPRLWTPETPDLYQVHCEVVIDGRVVDSAAQPFGIRSLELDATRGLRLNGQPLKLKGGCVHHDNGVLGAASYPRSEERKVALLKASGFNAVRCAHNPPAPSFLDACDRLGMLVIDESFDCWREGKTPYDYHLVFDDWWQRDLAGMVQRDRNHPSIIMWSIGNEVVERDGRSGGEGTARQLAALVRNLDPSRPITAALCTSAEGKDWSVMDKVFSAVDVCGYNYEWKKYQSDHERLPGRIMYGSESKPAEALDSWMGVLDHDFVIGDFVWAGLEYLGEAGVGRVHYDPARPFMAEFPWRLANCGDLDLCGFRRPQSYYRGVLWGSGEELFIAVHPPHPDDRTPIITAWGWPEVSASWTWKSVRGQPLLVDVYSACEKVELFLNGRSLGTRPSGRSERYTARFEVPYEPGELKAVGYRRNQAAAATSLITAGRAAFIRLVPDRDTIKSDPLELAYFKVEITDRKGRLQPLGAYSISFEVQGEGRLLAVGNADPQNNENNQRNQCRSFQGCCLAVVRSSGRTGAIRLVASAKGLVPGEAMVQVTG